MHQHRDRGLRYFKWGVARLILEAQPAPDVVPVFIDGTDRIMAEDRGFPRFVPRAAKKVRVVFGQALDFEAAFGDLRRRWEGLVERERAAAAAAEAWTETAASMAFGELPDALKHGREAQELRAEVARRMRDEILKLRRSLGYPDEDPSHGLAETWARKPSTEKKYKSRVDNSLVNQD